MFVVYFHNVVEGELDPLDARASRLPVGRFARAMEFLKAHFRPVGLDEFLDRLHSGRADSRCVAVTFDDAYAGVGRVAAPVMEALEIPGAVFAVTGCLAAPGTLLHFEEMEVALRLTGAERLELPELGFPALKVGSEAARAVLLKRVKTALKGVPDARRAEVQALVLQRLGVDRRAMEAFAAGSERLRKHTAEELLGLARAGWCVGGHTRTHRVLAQLPADQAVDEIAGCHRDLAEALGTPPRFFAYPYGKPEHIGPGTPERVREAGFAAAFSTLPGSNGPGEDPFILRRVEFIDLLACQDRDLQEKARLAFRP